MASRISKLAVAAATSIGLVVGAMSAQAGGKDIVDTAVSAGNFKTLATALGAAGIEEFSFVGPTITGAVLVAITVLCGGLALRRLARVG